MVPLVFVLVFSAEESTLELIYNWFEHFHSFVVWLEEVFDRLRLILV